MNPEPCKKALNSLSYSLWNFRSTNAHDFIKKSSTEKYTKIHNYDIICLSETFFDSAAIKDAFSVSGYNLMHAGHPDVKTEGRLCSYSGFQCCKYLSVSNVWKS